MIEDEIASRVLHCQLRGETTEVVVRLGRPRQEKNHFVRQYEISMLGDSEAYCIAGKDSIQVMQLAMVMVGSALHSIDGASGWSWDGEPFIGLPKSLDQPMREW